MPVRQNKLQNRGRVIQRTFDPITEPLPIEKDRFKTIITADGKRVQTTQSLQELWYNETYGRQLVQDIWMVRIDFAGLNLLFGWNLPALPIKIEILNGCDLPVYANITGTFTGPGVEPSLTQWNQAIKVPQGVNFTVPNVGRVNVDTTGQRYIEIFSPLGVPTFGEVEVILHFADQVPAPVQYTPP